LAALVEITQNIPRSYLTGAPITIGQMSWVRHFEFTPLPMGDNKDPLALLRDTVVSSVYLDEFRRIFCAASKVNAPQSADQCLETLRPTAKREAWNILE
jgi:hypothetical protein